MTLYERLKTRFNDRSIEIIKEHYLDNDYTEVEFDEITDFWKEYSVSSVDHIVKLFAFNSWADMKGSEHVGKFYNVGKGRVLIFADWKGGLAHQMKLDDAADLYAWQHDKELIK